MNLGRDTVQLKTLTVVIISLWLYCNLKFTLETNCLLFIPVCKSHFEISSWNTASFQYLFTEWMNQWMKEVQIMKPLCSAFSAFRWTVFAWTHIKWRSKRYGQVWKNKRQLTLTMIRMMIPLLAWPFHQCRHHTLKGFQVINNSFRRI